MHHHLILYQPSIHFLNYVADMENWFENQKLVNLSFILKTLLFK